jgi:transposase-like protein
MILNHWRIRYRGGTLGEPPNIKTTTQYSTSTRDNSTTIDPTQAVMEANQSREDGASFRYRKVAEKLGVDRTTLSRWHQGS